MYFISIIIPTLNRSLSLLKVLESLASIIQDKHNYEIIVVDNNSSDETKSLTLNFIKKFNYINIRYIFESTPGLLAVRHRGFDEASGDVLAYLDDDVIVSNNWLEGIIEAFKDPSVHLAGGPSFPYYEESPSQWLEYFWTRESNLHCCSWLSLIWQGDIIKECDPKLIWGLNFCIRKKTMEMLGGFNPDCIPGHLQHYQGDGESGLAEKLRNKGLTSIYHPKIMVYHVIPKERLTHDYFKKRFYYEGVVNSYADIRKNRDISLQKEVENQANESETVIMRFRQKVLHPRSSIRWYLKQKGFIKKDDSNSTISEKETLRAQFYQAYLYGYNFHQEMVKNYPVLLEWVLKEDYFDYQLPDLKGCSN